MARAGFSMFSAMVTAVLSTWNWRPLALYEVPDTIMTQATQIHVLFSDSFHHLFPRFSWFWFNAAKLIFGGRKSAELNYSAWWTKLETEFSRHLSVIRRKTRRQMTGANHWGSFRHECKCWKMKKERIVLNVSVRIPQFLFFLVASARWTWSESSSLLKKRRRELQEQLGQQSTDVLSQQQRRLRWWSWYRLSSWNSVAWFPFRRVASLWVPSRLCRPKCGQRIGKLCCDLCVVLAFSLCSLCFRMFSLCSRPPLLGKLWQTLSRSSAILWPPGNHLWSDRQIGVWNLAELSEESLEASWKLLVLEKKLLAF